MYSLTPSDGSDSTSFCGYYSKPRKRRFFHSYIEIRLVILEKQTTSSALERFVGVLTYHYPFITILLVLTLEGSEQTQLT
jgi:hypothetical protein